MSHRTHHFRNRVARLRDASLPFVTRTFRGRRLKHSIALSVLLGVLSVLVGVWIAFGTGEFERDVRVGLAVEQSLWERDYVAFQVTATDVEQYRRMRRDPAHAYEVDNARRYAAATLATATSFPAPAQHRELADRARELLMRTQGAHDGGDARFSWHDPNERARLRAIVDKELEPNVVLYASPLSIAGGVRMIGATAGGFVVLLMLVVAPLVCGSTFAQEVHENTLQPVLGTRLRPVDIVTGILVSGLCLGGVLALPSIVVLVVTGIAVGHVTHLASWAFLLPAASAFTALAMALLGYAMGRRWSSGVVGTLLTGLLCTLMMMSVGLGLQLDDETIGLIALFPSAGLVHELRELFVPGTRLAASEVAWATVVTTGTTVGLALLAWTIARALTRRIEGRTKASITRIEAFCAAITVAALAMLVIPDFNSREGVAAYFATLGLVCGPWMLLLAGRVPVGEGPAKLRSLPLRALMLEFAGYVAVHAAVLVIFVGMSEVPWSVEAAFHLSWSLVVLALVAIRTTALPNTIADTAVALLSLAASAFSFGSAAMFASAASRPAGDMMHFVAGPIFPFFAVSTVLGVVQVALTVAIPVLLLRGLAKGTAGLR